MAQVIEKDLDLTGASNAGDFYHLSSAITLAGERLLAIYSQVDTAIKAVVDVEINTYTSDATQWFVWKSGIRGSQTFDLESLDTGTLLRIRVRNMDSSSMVSATVGGGN